MHSIRTASFSIVAALAIASPTPAMSAGFADVLDTPAAISPLATKTLLQAVTRAGANLVAVGPRGHVVLSRDGGATWKQSSVPVSSDLTAVFFVGDKQGWAVGHDGVILHTSDGGERWELQLNGLSANDLLVSSMEKKLAAEPASEDAKKLLAEAKRYKDQGADKPFLDVWFSDEMNGYVVGAYNLIFKTSDGGKRWEPWFDRTENPKFFNLYAIRPAPGGLYIVGEGGLVLKLDPASDRFKALTLAYNGSFFGLVEAKSSVLVYGLRGNVYRSDDAGKSWTKVNAGLPATIVAGTQTRQGTTMLADVGGRVVGTNDGTTFTPLTLKNAVPLTGIADAGEGKLALVGPRGVSVTEVAAR